LILVQHHHSARRANALAVLRCARNAPANMADEADDHQYDDGADGGADNRPDEAGKRRNPSWRSSHTPMNAPTMPMMMFQRRSAEARTIARRAIRRSRGQSA
jgi:hypothetical protein